MLNLLEEIFRPNQDFSYRLFRIQELIFLPFYQIINLIQRGIPLLKNPCHLCITRPMCIYPCNSSRTYNNFISDLKTCLRDTIMYAISMTWFFGAPYFASNYFDIQYLVFFVIWCLFHLFVIAIVLISSIINRKEKNAKTRSK